MKIKFQNNLDYQLEAVKAVTDIFEGQEICRTNFTVVAPKNTTYLNEIGVANRLELHEEEVLANVQRIQLRNGLKQSHKLGSYNFTVEMETGTGKTYVYLRTIFELNKLYGFTKFIIVVPSIAIKEGTNKSLDITSEHFKGLYDNVTYDYFTYDSQKLEQVRSFATNDYIQIMVINIDAFRKSFDDPNKEDKSNIIHRYNDKLGYAPIELIRETSPILIIDEPQSVDSTPKSKEAIASLNPLCSLRYSATHKEKYNLIYKLDAVDAYERKLVKQIEVASLAVDNFNNTAYMRLVSVDNKKSPITAKIELDVNDKGKVKRATKTIKQNDDLLEITKRDIYEGYIVNDISCEKGNEYVDFTSKEEVLYIGKPLGSVDDDLLKRQQIHKTIEEHLEKEVKLNPKGIKVLSLFFIDKVSNYRAYAQDGNVDKGKYAVIFEEEYKKIIKRPKYRTIFEGIKDLDEEVINIHDGYFSQDKKGILKDTKGTTAADDDTYSLIMKDKEKLLSFDSKLRFIFSHSALREGWDNPNVFQICTLNETTSEVKKRQEIGRGLRLAVNQDGERLHGFDINTLTVMANESYDEFVSKLQKEIEDDSGIRFGVVEPHTFANVVVSIEGEEEHYLGNEKSEYFYNYMLKMGYIDLNGKVLDPLKIALRDDKVNIPEDLNGVKGQINSQLKRIAGNLNIKNAEDRKPVKVNKGVLLSPEFQELWDKVKYKTTYSVEFDSSQLVEKCAEALQRDVVVSKGKFIYTKAKTEITRGGAEAVKVQETTSIIEEDSQNLPDILSYIQNETNLTRKSIAEILVKSKRLDAFKKNPQKFIDVAIDTIKTQMRHFIIDGIKYHKIGEDEFYSQELFEKEELYGHLKQSLVESSKSPYEYVVYDSSVEAKMAKRFEESSNIRVYAKLPGWFTIDTPLGSYNPDWIVLWENNGEETLYFVVETKGAISWEFLRAVEKGKIECGKKHFEALGNKVQLEIADTFESLSDRVMSC